MSRRRPLRLSEVTPATWRAFEHGQFEKDYARWMDAQEKGDAERDERERRQEVDDDEMRGLR